MKKAMSLLLAVVLSFGIFSVAAAAASGKITDVIMSIDTNYTPPSEVQEGAVLYFPLTANMFEWSGNPGTANEAVTTSQLNSGNVTVRTSSADSSVFKSISLTTANAGGQRTACVKVEFVEDFVSTSDKDYKVTLYLAVGNNRKEASKYVLEGTLENPVSEVSSGTDYFSFTNSSRVLAPRAYINNIELDLGEGVLMKTRVYADRKYYGKAKVEVTSADDAVLTRYPSIDEIVVIKQVNLKTTGNYVYLEGYDKKHVYDSTGKYLGQAPAAMAYSDKYYISSTKIDMGGGVSGGSSSSSSSGSSAGSSSQSSGGTTGGTTSGGSISTDSARSLTQAAINTAKSSGSTVAQVRVKDSSSISATALQTMRSTASASNMTARLIADTMNGNSVAGRMTINAANAANLTGDIQLPVRVDSASFANTKATFDKYFANKTAFVNMAHNGSLGMSVTVAAKVDLSGLNTSSLYLYSYNRSTNQYARIQNPNYSVDANGYLHFTTSAGGDIIITDSAMARK